MEDITVHTLLEAQAIYHRTDLISIARKGIQAKYLVVIQEFTSLSDKELSAILPISQRQLVRYEKTHKLNKEITSHLIQLIELFQKGYKLFGKEKFKLWIRTPNKVLNQKTPIEIMDTSIGIELIEDVIGRIEHGVYS